MSTGLERIAAAFSPAGAPEIPVIIPYDSIFIRDHWAELTPCPWWYARSPEIEHQLAWRSDIIPRIGQDRCTLPEALSREARAGLTIEIRDDGVFRMDRNTGQAERLSPPRVGGWPEDGEVASVHAGQMPASLGEIDALLPTTEEIGEEKLRADGSSELADALFNGPARGLAPLDWVGAPLWSTYYLWGFEGIMTLVVERPDLVEYACGRLLSDAIATVHRAAVLGGRIVWIEDCMTDMIGPRAFARLNLPFLQAITREVRSLGMWSIHYFSGNPAGKWEHLLNTGADALSLEESKKGFSNNIEEIVARVASRMVVLGNLDAIGVLQDGTEGDLRAEITRQIAAGRRNGSRFIMSLGSPVTPATPVERVRLYCDLAHEIGGR